MSRTLFRAVVVVLASLPLTAGEARAQEYVTRYEVGGQFSRLTINKPDRQFTGLTSSTTNDSGFGARFTFNATRNIAFEAEVNVLPRPLDEVGVPTGRVYQGQFGVKAGRRFRRLGLFAKLRPGFVTFTKVSQYTGSTPTVVVFDFIGAIHFNTPHFRFAKETYGSVDFGGAVEFYPSRRTVVRFDVGDTLVRYDAYSEDAKNEVCTFICIPRIFERPPQMLHNLQFSLGLAFRF